jgi:hypothetical protein
MINKALGVSAPPDLQTARIYQRLYEMSIEQNGGTPPPEGSALAAPWVRAARQRSGPLWDAAAADVARERGLRSLNSFALPSILTPSAVLGDTEAALRQARSAPILDGKLVRRLHTAATQTPDAPVSEGIVAQLEDMAWQIARGTGRGEVVALHPELQSRLDHPTARNVWQVYQWLAEADVRNNPLARGYPESGSPEKQQLQALLAEYNNLPAQFMNDPAMAGLPSENLVNLGEFAQDFRNLPPLLQQLLLQRRNTQTAILNQGKKYREQMAEQYPILKAYLAYQAEHAAKGRGALAPQLKTASAGSLDDFLENVWRPSQSVRGR